MLEGLIAKALGNDSLQADVAQFFAEFLKRAIPGEIVEAELGDFLILAGGYLGGNPDLADKAAEDGS